MFALGWVNPVEYTETALVIVCFYLFFTSFCALSYIEPFQYEDAAGIKYTTYFTLFLWVDLLLAYGLAFWLAPYASIFSSIVVMLMLALLVYSIIKRPALRKALEIF